MGCQRIRGNLCAPSCQQRRTVFAHQVCVDAQSSVVFSGGVRTVTSRDIVPRLSSHVYSAASLSLPRFFGKNRTRTTHRFCFGRAYLRFCISYSHHIPGNRPTRRRILRCSQLIGTSVRFARPSSTANGRILRGIEYVLPQATWPLSALRYGSNRAWQTE